VSKRPFNDVPIGPDMRMAVVGSPGYFAAHDKPKAPHDLAHHACINLRFPTLGGLYAWEFEKGGKEINVRVKGQLVVNDISLARQAALDDAGLAYLPKITSLTTYAVARSILSNWTPPFAGYHLYFPSRRQQSPALAVLIDALRYRG
jgi:DNA-binding transcriptional LysR family regulator